MLESSRRLHAFVIGVGEYLYSPFKNLPAAPADAEEISTILCDPDLCGYPADQVTTLIGKQATLQGVRSGFKHLSEVCGPDDTAVIYFSGHGGRALQSNERRVFLCLRDTNPYDLAMTGLSELELSAAIRFINAERLVVILDSCFASGGAQFKSAPFDGPWEPGYSSEFFDGLNRGSGRVLMASSREDQFSIVRPQGDLSLFTYHLGQALRGKAAVRRDGFIRVLDVFDYVSEAVKRENPEQTPILKVDNVDSNFAIGAVPIGAQQTSQRAGTERESTRTRPEADASSTPSVGGQDEEFPGIHIEQLNAVYSQIFTGHGYTLNFYDDPSSREKRDS